MITSSSLVVAAVLVMVNENNCSSASLVLDGVRVANDVASAINASTYSRRCASVHTSVTTQSISYDCAAVACDKRLPHVSGFAAATSLVTHL